MLVTFTAMGKETGGNGTCLSVGRTRLLPSLGRDREPKQLEPRMPKHGACKEPSENRSVHYLLFLHPVLTKWKSLKSQRSRRPRAETDSDLQPQTNWNTEQTPFLQTNLHAKHTVSLDEHETFRQWWQAADKVTPRQSCACLTVITQPEGHVHSKHENDLHKFST